MGCDDFRGVFGYSVAVVLFEGGRFYEIGYYSRGSTKTVKIIGAIRAIIRVVMSIRAIGVIRVVEVIRE